MGNKLTYPEEDLSGKVAIVTGGNTGIGYETAKGLARLGAHTFIACRSQERAEVAIERMKGELNAEPGQQKETKEVGKGEGTSSPGKEDKGGDPKTPTPQSQKETDKVEVKGEEGQSEIQDTPVGGHQEASDSEAKVEEIKGGEEDGVEKKEVKLEFLPLDLSSFQSTMDFVRSFKEKGLPLHILINNAAVAWIPFRLTDDGFEEQFQVNHLSPMLLTLELLPVLLETAASSGDGRIIFVSSRAHTAASTFNAEKLVITSEADYDRFKTYPNTKLYNIMVGHAFQRRIVKSGITLSTLEPGYVKTELARGWQDKSFLAFLNKIGYAVVARSPVEGAATSLNCAVNPSLNTEESHYYSSCKVAAPSGQARVKEFQEILWKKSIELLKEHLSPEILEKYGEAQLQPTPPTAIPKDTPSDQPPAEDAPPDQPPAEDTPPDQPPAKDTTFSDQP